MLKLCYVTTIPITIESFFIPQLQYLAANDFDVTIVCSNDSNLQKKIGNSIHFYPIEIPRGISIGGSIYAFNTLKRFFKEEKFDLIQYSTPNAAFCASIAAKIAGCKVRNYHLMGLRYLGASGIEQYVLKILEKITCYISTSIECVSKSNMDMVIKEGLSPAEKVSVVWNGSTGGIDLSRFDSSKRQQWRLEIRQKLGYDVDDFIFGFVGRITRDKGINELLSAFLEMKSDSKLLLIGNIEENNNLDSALLATAMQNSNIKIHDSISDIEHYYAAIDVLVLPSYREGFGNVIIEAAAMGTPAIVSNIPGPTDAIASGITAITVEPKNTEDLVEKMLQIKSLDYQAMGRSASEFAKEKFDSKMLCQKILERKQYLLRKDAK